MNDSQNVSSYEYKNDYLYIVIRQVPEVAPGTYTYCCGINLSRFKPLCWRKAGICSNPAVRGLQLLRIDVAAYALKLGLRTRWADMTCSSMTPAGEGWYRERPLLIDNAFPDAVRGILEFSVTDLVRLVLCVAVPDAKPPKKLPNPQEMQAYLDSLSRNVKTSV